MPNGLFMCQKARSSNPKTHNFSQQKRKCKLIERKSHQRVADVDPLSIVPLPVQHLLKVFAPRRQNEPVSFHARAADAKRDVAVAALFKKSGNYIWKLFGKGSISYSTQTGIQMMPMETNKYNFVCFMFISGQSYKQFMLINYDSRVTHDLKVPHITTLGS